MCRFLSDRWFAEAARLVLAVRPQPVPSSFVKSSFASSSGCRLQHDVGGVRWHQVVEGGVVRAWGPGDLDAPDVTLHWERAHARSVARREVDGTEALCGVRVHGGPPAPMDLADRPELTDLPSIPGASVTAQYEFPAGPYGPVAHAIAFVDGRVDTMTAGRVAHADVTVEVPYLVMALVRRGDLTILDALEHGRVDGDIGALALLGGIVECPEFHRAELACGPSGVALGVLGATLADPAYQDALVRLAELTDPTEP